MARRVIKSFRDKTDNNKFYQAKSKNLDGDVYESKDSKRIAFLVAEGFLVEEVKEKPTETKKGNSRKKAGE